MCCMDSSGTGKVWHWPELTTCINWYYLIRVSIRTRAFALLHACPQTPLFLQSTIVLSFPPYFSIPCSWPSLKNETLVIPCSTTDGGWVSPSKYQHMVDVVLGCRKVSIGTFSLLFLCINGLETLLSPVHRESISGGVCSFQTMPDFMTMIID